MGIKMDLLKRLFIFGCLMLACFLIQTTNLYASTGIKDMRVGNQTDGARIVFDMNKNVNYRVFLLNNPRRVVVDLSDSDIGQLLTNTKNQVVDKIRVGKMTDNDKRVVLEISRPAVVKKAFILPPQSGQNWRLVIDLRIVAPREFDAKVGNKDVVTNNTKFAPREDEKQSSYAYEEKSAAKISSGHKHIVVLDPGHGGKDPGAIGAYAKTYEKNITLAMGKELKQILQQKGYEVYLTRDRDIFIPLRQRIKIAQKYKAELFMSIHADSAQNRNATGLSVYTLSDTASDKEAAALAERENKADIIGGIDLGGNSKEVNDILISLSQTDTRNKSSKYATYLVQEMSKGVKLVKNTHRFAGFAVLKAPDVPSVLLEMGYLSNRTEEANLKTPYYRKKLAEAAARAIDRYFKDPEIASY